MHIQNSTMKGNYHIGQSMFWLIGCAALLAVWGGALPPLSAILGSWTGPLQDSFIHDNFYVVARPIVSIWCAVMIGAFAIGHYVMPRLTGRKMRAAVFLLHLALIVSGVILALLPSIPAGFCAAYPDVPDFLDCLNRINMVVLSLFASGTIVFFAGHLFSFASKATHK